jgi:NADPH:quinone reductase-like Zn-dependent oxidoreductase
MRCAQIVQPNEPLHVSEVDLPSVRGHQVLVKVAAAGVCHTGYSLRRSLILFRIALTCWLPRTRHDTYRPALVGRWL